MNAILFDLDGTLVDSLHDIGAAMNHALRSLGMPEHPLDDYRALVGEGARRLAERALPPDRGDLVDAAFDAYRPYYRDHALDATRPYPGIRELLAELRVPLAVLSNKPDEPTRQLVAAMFPGVAFGYVAGQRPGVPLKPDPTSALEAAAALGARPETCVLLGDTRIDMETALAAGMIPIGAAWGFRPEELRAAGARALIDDPLALLRWL